nr:uncharacterized protein LOC109156029 [Ipomoea trifida]
MQTYASSFLGRLLRQVSLLNLTQLHLDQVKPLASRKSSMPSPASRIFSLDPFHDVLNIGATIYKATTFDIAMMNEVSTTSFHDLMDVEERKPPPPPLTHERQQIEGKP